VPDWSAILRDRITDSATRSARTEEIRAELAGQLDDEYQAARGRGCSEDEATACALSRVPDWNELELTIQRESEREKLMSPDARTLLLPGLTAVVGAALVLRFVTLPSAPPPLATIVALLLSYVVLGGVGAYLSKRAGGGSRTRFVAGIFPLFLHLMMIVPAIVLSNLTERRVHSDHVWVNLQLRVLVAFVLVPGIALAIGTVPFLRRRA
jgi:hypothetical protein